MSYLASSSLYTMDMVDLVVRPWAWLTWLPYHGHGWHDCDIMDMVIMVQHVGPRCQYCLTYLAWPYLGMLDIVAFIDHSFLVYNVWRDSHGWPASMVAMFEGIEKFYHDLRNVCQYMKTLSVDLKLVGICKVCHYIKSGSLWFYGKLKSFATLWKGCGHIKSFPLYEMFVEMVLWIYE